MTSLTIPGPTTTLIYIKIVISLFIASIMSKKAAEGIDALVLEVTYGKAAMMKTEKEARDLARVMVHISGGSRISQTRGGVNLRVRQFIIWQHFCRKLHENKRNWTEMGSRP